MPDLRALIARCREAPNARVIVWCDVYAALLDVAEAADDWLRTKDKLDQGHMKLGLKRLAAAMEREVGHAGR